MNYDVLWFRSHLSPSIYLDFGSYSLTFGYDEEGCLQTLPNIIGKDFKKLKKVVFGYSCCSEQEHGIQGLKNEFDIDIGNNVVRKAAHHLYVYYDNDFKILSIGNPMVQGNIYKNAWDWGLAAYWDDHSIEICALANNYGFVIDLIQKMLKPCKSKLYLDSNDGIYFSLVIERI